MTRPPRLKAKPMAGRRGDAEKRRDGDYLFFFPDT
jgi:hypothetical protein